MKKQSKTFQKLLPNWVFPWGMIATFIFLVTAWFRFWELGSSPTGITWDEAFLGYVGKMVITTRRDDYWRLLPLVFESFGDFKAPLAVYITGLSTTVLGLSPWAVRLPFAIAGTLTVGVTGALMGLRTKSWGWALLSSWFLATLPWHIHFSRVGFESGMALFGFSLVLLAWQMLRQPRLSLPTKWLAWILVWCGTWGALYVYHSSKIVIPAAAILIGAWELIFHWKIWKTRLLEIGAGIGVGVIGLIPFLWSLTQGGTTRGTQTFFWNQASHMSAPRELLHNIVSHLSPDFWVFGATQTLRHGTGVAGVSTITLCLALLIGLGWIIWLQQSRGRGTFSSWFASLQSDLWIWGALTGVGILPALLGSEVPHSNRAFLAAVPLIVLTVLILKHMWETLQGNTKQLVIACVILFSFLETAAFWQDLTTSYNERSATAWLDGNLDVSRWAVSRAAAGETVTVTTEYGQPQIFYAFVTDLAPEKYRWKDYGGVSFASEDIVVKSQSDSIATAKKIESDNYILEGTIDREDGLPAFWLYKRISD